MKAILWYGNENAQELEVKTWKQDGKLVVQLPEEVDYSDIDWIDFAVDYAQACTGEDGYLVIPHGNNGLKDDSLCFFYERPDCRIEIEGPVMMFYGMVSEKHSFAAFVTGMTYDYMLVVEVNQGIYRIYPRFYIGGRTPYEPIEV